MTTEKILVEILNQLSPEDFHQFKLLLHTRCSQFKPWEQLIKANTEDVVKLLVELNGKECVEETRKILLKMNRTDLVQRLSGVDSGAKVSDQQQIPLTHRVEMMVSVIELLLETLADLSVIQLERYKYLIMEKIPYVRSLSLESLMLKDSDLQDTVFAAVQTFGQQSVEVTMEVLQEMKMTDLMKRLSDSSSGPTKKPLDEHLSALIHKEATLVAVRELLLETLKDLSEQELRKFKWFLQYTCFQKSLPQISLEVLLTADSAAVVDVMMRTWDQQSLEVTMEVLMDMDRTDLVQRLSETSSGPKVEHRVDERWPALIHKVEMMVSVIELLLETLADLSDIQLRDFHRHLREIHRHKYDFMFFLMLKDSDLQDTVFSVVQTFGQQSVEVTMEVLQKMKMTHLMKRLSDSSSGPTKKPLDEHLSALIHKVATLAAVRELLLETLKDLSKQELRKVKWFLQYTCFQKSLPQIPLEVSLTADSADVVDAMMRTCGQQSLEVTMEVLMDMDRTDLVQRLPETSSGPKVEHRVDERWPALIQKVEMMVSVIELLLETLADLSDIQLRVFHLHLREILYFRADSGRSLTLLEDSDLQGIVFKVVQTFGQQSVEVTMEVLQEMKMTDLMKRLSDSSSGPTKKHSVDEHHSALIQKVATMAAVQQLLVETLEDLSYEELKTFMDHLKTIVYQRNPSHTANLHSVMNYKSLSSHILDVMMKELGQQSLEETREILEEMNRTDLVQRLLKTSSGLKEPSTSLDPEGSVKQDSSNWTKLEPKVNRTDAAKAPTYSLQSEAGHFECSVSGLRWVCEEKASFKYQFWSWEGHMERMERIHYRPAGPLMDITVMTGKLNEAYLPHWICIEDNPDILNQFAVLHVNDCGDDVEDASEVTASHVKLKEPIFSPRAVLLRAGLPVKINCNVLIYQTNTAFLTLHVYLIPRDDGLKQAITQDKLSRGYKEIEKSKPEKSLKIRNRFLLTADMDGAQICPKEGLKLRHETSPNFFEVYIKNPNRDFHLELTQRNGPSVWTCPVREGEYRSTDPPQASGASAGAAGGRMTAEGKHFVDQHQLELIRRVSNIKPILDELFVKDVIQQEAYVQIRVMSTCQDKMRALYDGPLKASVVCKDIFYEILQKHEKHLITDLNKGQ